MRSRSTTELIVTNVFHAGTAICARCLLRPVRAARWIVPGAADELVRLCVDAGGPSRRARDRLEKRDFVPLVLYRRI
jgi:hypothetical protein